MEKIYKGAEFMEYPKEKKVYNLSTGAIPIEFIEKWKSGKTSIEQVVADKIIMDYKYKNY